MSKPFSECQYVDSFVIPLHLGTDDGGVNAVLASYATYNANPSFIQTYGRPTLAGSLYSSSFTIPVLKSQQVKYIRIKSVKFNEIKNTNAYNGNILIKSNMIDTSDHTICTLNLSGETTFSTAFNVNEDYVLKVSTPLQGAFSFDYYFTSVKYSGTDVNTIVDTDIAIFCECYA